MRIAGVPAPVILKRPFSPRDIPGLKLWLDASDAATLWQDAAKTVPAVADGDVIGAWADKGGSGNDATQATTANKPILKLAIQNGKPVVRFDGVNDFLEKAHHSSLALSTLDIFVVAKPTTLGSTPIQKMGTNGDWVSPWSEWNLRFWNSSPPAGNDLQFFLYEFTGKNVETSGIDHFSGAFFLLEGFFDGVTLGVRSNGANLATTAPTSGITNTTNPLRIGVGNPASEYMNGDIAELLVYNSALSAAQRQQVENYLNNKWQIY